MGSRFSRAGAPNRNLRRALAVGCLSALGAAAGCNVFDESLEERIDQTGDGDGDGDIDGGTVGDGDGDSGGPGEVDAGNDAGPALFTLADTCGSVVPEVTSRTDPMMISITGLKSDVSENQACSVSPEVLSKSDGFFRIHARGGQRWHFHLNPAAGQNLAVFVAKDCSDVTRQCVAAADVCGVNESEHFTFVAEQAGDYVVALDGIDPATANPLSLLAISPECGDNNKLHGEGCDDGNVNNGDGCDNACRIELSGATVAEAEPNDDTYLANVIVSNLEAPQRINGKVAGPACQPDYYLINVPATRVLDIKVKSGSGGVCAGAPEMGLELFGTDQQKLREGVRLAHDEGDGEADCPVLSQTVNAGSYFVRLSRLRAAAQFDYQLELTLTQPVAE
jgi:cysteine-rich repeat protein